MAHTSQDWELRHDIQAANAVIYNAKQLNVELLVQHGSDQPETRSVSVKIMSLNY